MINKVSLYAAIFFLLLAVTSYSLLRSASTAVTGLDSTHLPLDFLTTMFR